ncbi:MAG: TonB-dependent receptor [candidate division Zixibacteria bacterium]|nr:TonB-dependent receptor [candidate division Zixibacteria bacterium]
MARKWICTLALGITITTISPSTQSQDINPVYELKDIIVVTGAISPVKFSELPRSIEVIGPDQIAQSPAITVAELLAQVPGVDVRRRGANGVQADISIRGGTFEQTLVMIDGVPLSDPQTGHHNLDLPLNLNDIKQIEVLKGPGSRLFGPGAMGGAINIITRQPQETAVRLKTIAGNHGLFDHSLAVSMIKGKTQHRLSLGRRACEGHVEGAEFDVSIFSYGISFPVGDAAARFDARYTDKEFGAYRFYSDRFPDEWEATSSLLLSGGVNYEYGKAVVSTRAFWRRHDDEFILDRNRPQWYCNQHTTDVFGGEARSYLTTEWGVTSLAVEISAEEIESSSLGDHRRSRTGLFLEHRFTPITNVSVVPGATVYHYEDWGWRMWPGVDIGYRPTETTNLFFTVGKSFRVPTYTDLYYESPANMGNPDLEPEEAWTYEIGGRWSHPGLLFNAAVFVRNGQNLIDWSRLNSEDDWQAHNVSEVTTRGMEIGVVADPTKLWGGRVFSKLHLSYTYLDADYSSRDYESKYVHDHLQHQLILRTQSNLTSIFHLSSTVRYLRRFEHDGSIVVDTRLRLRMEDVEFMAEIDNLFDADYTEIGTVPMPGRWLRVGLSLNTDGL